MTRSYGRVIRCPQCGYEHTEETDLSRWTRNNRNLDSNAEGLMILDFDHIVHRYKVYTSETQSRDVQCIMFVEEKTHGAALTDQQQDSLWIANQVLRNRRQTPTKRLRRERGRAPLTAFSPYNNRHVNLRFYGIHLLRLSGTDPTNSDAMWWDGQRIDTRTLELLLRFDLDPDTLAPMDFRRHHAERMAAQPLLLSCGSPHSALRLPRVPTVSA